jgi:hypothetical protein
MKRGVISGLVLLHCAFAFASFEPVFLSATGFGNRTVTSTNDFGIAVAAGVQSGSGSILCAARVQVPEIDLAVAAVSESKRSRNGLSFLYGGKLHSFFHVPTNSKTSFTEFCGVSARTPHDRYWTDLSATVGLQVLGSRSRYYDDILWGFAPHLRATLVQAIGEIGYCTLFVSTDTLLQEESQLSYLYGLSLALRLSDSLFLRVRPMARLSDYPDESLFVTMHELSVSFSWFDGTKDWVATERQLP